jgi:hypothetical protein
VELHILEVLALREVSVVGGGEQAAPKSAHNPLQEATLRTWELRSALAERSAQLLISRWKASLPSR